MGNYFVLLVVAALTTGASGCFNEPQSVSGVSMATVKVATGSDDLTVEQRNVRDRLVLDNKPGSIKHLYVISAYSGDVILYSTVKGKVTSSGKRLTPYTVAYGSEGTGFYLEVPGSVKRHETGEVLQDDGTYGSSIDYLFWWDQRGVYHQHYVQGGQIVHISDQPMRVGKVILNLEETGAK